jgi:hypothetical protein
MEVAMALWHWLLGLLRSPWILYIGAVAGAVLVAMALWHWLLGLLASLYIGAVAGVVLVLWLWRGRNRTVMTHDDLGVDTNEHKRRADYLAADAARTADARLPPHNPGGFNF